jgi:hypothetical protein
MPPSSGYEIDRLLFKIFVASYELTWIHALEDSNIQGMFSSTYIYHEVL